MTPNMYCTSNRSVVKGKKGLLTLYFRVAGRSPPFSDQSYKDSLDLYTLDRSLIKGFS